MPLTGALVRQAIAHSTVCQVGYSPGIPPSIYYIRYVCTAAKYILEVGPSDIMGYFT